MRIEKKIRNSMLASRTWIFLSFFVLSASFGLEASRALGTFLSRRSRQNPFSRKKATEYYLNFFKTGAQCTCQMGERKCSISFVL